MPMIRANGTALYYEDTGGSGAPVVFSHGLFWNTTLFAPQIAALKNRYRCIAYDHRGQGRSADDVCRAIDMKTVTDYAAALIEASGCPESRCPTSFTATKSANALSRRLG